MHSSWGSFWDSFIYSYINFILDSIRNFLPGFSRVFLASFVQVFLQRLLSQFFLLILQGFHLGISPEFRSDNPSRILLMISLEIFSGFLHDFSRASFSLRFLSSWILLKFLLEILSGMILSCIAPEIPSESSTGIPPRFLPAIFQPFYLRFLLDFLQGLFMT